MPDLRFDMPDLRFDMPDLRFDMSDQTACQTSSRGVDRTGYISSHMGRFCLPFYLFLSLSYFKI
jgi:hypothetical protein